MTTSPPNIDPFALKSAEPRGTRALVVVGVTIGIAFAGLAYVLTRSHETAKTTVDLSRPAADMAIPRTGDRAEHDAPKESATKAGTAPPAKTHAPLRLATSNETAPGPAVAVDTEAPSATFKDTKTELEWQLKPTSRLGWEAADRRCKSLGYRLPTKDELLSLVDDDRDPKINPRFTMPPLKFTYFWTSSLDENAPGRAYVVGFFDGQATTAWTSLAGPGEGLYARCVRTIE